MSCSHCSQNKCFAKGKHKSISEKLLAGDAGATPYIVVGNLVIADQTCLSIKPCSRGINATFQGFEANVDYPQ